MQLELNEYNNIEYNNISEDWGWFIDIESITIIKSNDNMVKPNDNMRKSNYNIKKKLETIIEEDNYDYYYMNNNNLDSIENLYNINKNNNKTNLTYSKSIEFIINICSKTIACSLLTYIIFIII